MIIQKYNDDKRQQVINMQNQQKTNDNSTKRKLKFKRSKDMSSRKILSLNNSREKLKINSEDLLSKPPINWFDKKIKNNNLVHPNNQVKQNISPLK